MRYGIWDSTVEIVLETAVQGLIEAGCETPRLDAEVLLAHALDKDRTWLYTHPQEPLTENQVNRFYTLLSRRKRREPVAYITGHKEFFALEFQVNRHALIPRPETELLVEITLRIANERMRASTIVDVGTGSGCIAIALAKNLAQVSLLAIDTSEQALHLARQNAAWHGVVDRITFLAGDLLQPLAHPVDLIVSNPPYVSDLELAAASMSPEVSRYEPRLALAGGQDGLEIIRQLLPQAKRKLKPGGSLLIEIGAKQGQAVTQLARTHFPTAKIEVKKDLAGLDRLLAVETK